MSARRFAAVLGLTALLISTFSQTGMQVLAAPSDDFPECADGLDNDRDGEIDYPRDTGCSSLEDDSEGPSGRGLFIGLSDGLQTVKAGGNLTYTVSLTTDRAEQKLVQVRMLLPHQTNLLSVSNGGYRDGAYVLWDNVSVYHGTPRSLYVDVGVNPYAQQDLLLVAEVTSEGERATDTTRVYDKANDAPHRISPRITVDDGKAFAQPTEVLTYKITAKNVLDTEQTFTLHTTIPPELIFLNATGPIHRELRDIEWRNETLLPGETRTYLVTAAVERGASDFTVIRFRAASGPSVGDDTTSVLTGILPVAPSVSLTDGKRSVRPLEEVTYEIRIHNNEPVLATGVDANLALPTYAEFISATEGGQWTGDRVRWHNLTVSPNGERVLYARARIRSDAPYGEVLRASVEALGTQAVDNTEVSTSSVAARPLNIGGATATVTNPNSIVSKVADRREVRPGDSVGFTVTVRNPSNLPMTNVQVEDRLDSRYMTLQGAQDGRLVGDRILWTIPVLQPGQEWKTRYTVRIDPMTPHGTELRNIVTVAGDGLEAYTLTERVYTSSIGVMTNMPATGAAFDTLFLGLIGMVGAATTAVQRKKSRA